MRRISFWMLLAWGAAQAAATGGCGTSGGGKASDDTACGSLADGDTDISGHPVLDGSFAALLVMRDKVHDIGQGLQEAVDELCSVFDAQCPAGEPVGARVSHLKAVIDASISADIQGGIELCRVPPRCTSGIEEARMARFVCERDMGCDVDESCLESTFVECTGICRGNCAGPCSGACASEVVDWSCEGICQGSCETASAGECHGACQGTCAGECFGNREGDACDGHCSGTCIGICEACAPEPCPGSCTGLCLEEASLSGHCEGTCIGACPWECYGECYGDVGVVLACENSASCNASVDCHYNPARLAARAAVSCAGGEIGAHYHLAPGLDAAARAAVATGMDALSAVLVSVWRATGESTDLAGAGWHGEYGTPSGIEVGVAVFQELSSMFRAGQLDNRIDPERYECVQPAISEALELLVHLAIELAVLIPAQMELLFTLGIEP